MKTQTTTLLAFFAALAVAAPAPQADAAAEECAAATTPSCTFFTTTITKAAAAAGATAAEAASAALPAADAQATGAVDAAAGVNIQTFTGDLGGPPPAVISGAGDRPFSVNGDTFVGSGAALGRSCDVQHNKCANAANSGQLEGGTAQCETQNSDCHAAISAAKLKRELLLERELLLGRAALDLGSCSDPSIKFADGLDGRKEPSFIANNQQDFNHGSALKIGVIAGFICQRLDSTCKAGADAQSACSSASAAAVATSQDQAAADVFNSILAGGAAAAPTAAAANANLATTASAALAAVETVVQVFSSCS